MLKRLSTVGNSIALVLDKPIRDQLGIGRDTVVALSTDGKCLIVEPQPPGTELAARTPLPDPRRAELLEARATVSALEHVYGMTATHIARMFGRRSFAITVFSHTFELDNPQHTAAIAKLKSCLGRLQAGASWDDAIAG